MKKPKQENGANESRKDRGLLILVLVMMLVILLVVDIGAVYVFKGTKKVVERAVEGKYTAEEIIDGRTFALDNGDEVQMIGINVPDTESAANFLKILIEGKEVRLEKDVSDEAEGRMMRYVFLNDILVNAEMVRYGYAFPMVTEPDLKYKAEIDAARQECMNEKRNLCGR